MTKINLYTLHVPFTYEHIDAPSEAEFVTKSLGWIDAKIRAAITARGECLIGLSGGSTPKPIYEALAKDGTIDWNKVKIFLVDDRYVPATHKNSNQNFLKAALLDRIAIPAENVTVPDTTQPIAHCIDDYARQLVELLQLTPPDLVVLGMGPDGHIASLFPPVPKEAFGEVMVLHTTTDAFPVHDRISVSPLVIMTAQAHLLLLRGPDKRQILDEMLQSDVNPARWPMHVPLATGRVTVILNPVDR